MALRTESAALRGRDEELAATAASGAWLASLWQAIRAPGTLTAAQYDVDRVELRLRRSDGQDAPYVLAEVEGTQTTASFSASGATSVERTEPMPFTRTLMFVLEGGPTGSGTRRAVSRSERGLQGRR